MVFKQPSMTARTSAASCLAALVLLLSMMSTIITTSSPADSLEATARATVSAGNEAVALDALVEPMVSPVIESWFAALRLDTPQIATRVRIRTSEILRL